MPHDPRAEPVPFFPGWSLPLAVDRAADAFGPLADAARRLIEDAPQDAVRGADSRGFFRPAAGVH